ncbi:MAG: HEPN domain-containing protein [Candidatus Wallbacteria bacterium]
MEFYLMWLKKARTDLRTAKKLIKDDERILDTSVYHTQQCAEKALKGFLAFKKQNIQKTHDLELLIEYCSQVDNEFKNLIDDAIVLEPYCDEFRYPGNYDEPDLTDAVDAIERADRIILFVENKIKKELNASGKNTEELFKF